MRCFFRRDLGRIDAPNNVKLDHAEGIFRRELLPPRVLVSVMVIVGMPASPKRTVREKAKIKQHQPHIRVAPSSKTTSVKRKL